MPVYIDSNASGLNDGTSWTDAYQLVSTALAAEGDGTEYLIEYRHVENHSGSNRSYDFSTTLTTPDTLISVDKDNSDAYRKGAVIDINDNARNLEVNGFLFAAGVTVENGNGGSSFATDMQFASDDDDEQIWVDCVWRIHNEANSGVIAIGKYDNRVTLINHEYKTSNDAYLQLYSVDLVWLGGAYTCENAGDLPLYYFLPILGPTRLRMEGVDLSTGGTSIDITGTSSGSIDALIKRCKLAASWAGDLSNNDLPNASEIVLENCGAEDLNHAYKRKTGGGLIEHYPDLYASGTVGAKYNTSDEPISLNINSNTSVEPQFRQLHTQVLSLFNESTASRTYTWEFIHNDSAALQDDDIWMMISYLATSAGQVATIKDSAFDDKFGTFDPYATPANVTTSTKAWDGGLTERADSTVYVAGDIVKSSGSAGSAFICTVGGTSDSSVPAGFTSASDGDSITDNGVTWKAMRRQKCTLTLTAAEQGVVKAQLVLAKASIEVWASAELEAA